LDSFGYVFDGAWSTFCEIIDKSNETKKQLEILDFNVMFHRQYFEYAQSEFIHDSDLRQIELPNERSLLLVYALKGYVSVSLDSTESNQQTFVLHEFNLLRLEGVGKVALKNSSEFLFLLLRRKS
jgi:hypothetical protein